VERALLIALTMTTIKPYLTGKSRWGCLERRSIVEGVAQTLLTNGAPIAISESVSEIKALLTASNVKISHVRDLVISVRQDLIELLDSEIFCSSRK
jgi:hypothetical protein